jgi:hypothetical protein
LSSDAVAVIFSDCQKCEPATGVVIVIVGGRFAGGVGGTGGGGGGGGGSGGGGTVHAAVEAVTVAGVETTPATDTAATENV